MATLLRTMSVWDGRPGLPGYTAFHWGSGGGTLQEAADGAHARAAAFFAQVVNTLPSGVTIRTLGEVELINVEDGTLDSVWTATAGTSTAVGSAAGASPAPAGACISWSTGGIAYNRRVRGRTFLVPLAAEKYEADGTLSTLGISQISSACAVILDAGTGGPLSVWARPADAVLNPDGTVKRAARTGSLHSVTGYRVADKVAVLRSRRD